MEAYLNIKWQLHMRLRFLNLGSLHIGFSCCLIDEETVAWCIQFLDSLYLGKKSFRILRNTKLGVLKCCKMRLKIFFPDTIPRPSSFSIITPTPPSYRGYIDKETAVWDFRTVVSTQRVWGAFLLRKNKIAWDFWTFLS